MKKFSSLEICAGAGGQAIGLAQAGFEPVMLIDNDPHACSTLRANRTDWDVRQLDLLEFVGADHPQVLDVDLLAGGLPRPPYSAADSRNPLHAAVWLATEVRPRAIMLENVPALAKSGTFAETRSFAEAELADCGYVCRWNVLDAQDFGVPQRREHGVLVAMRPDDMARFAWPEPTAENAPTVGEVLWSSMASRGWAGAAEWRHMADEVAPTIIGGSKLRGGADLGPTRTKSIWARMGVNGGSIGDDVPGPEFVLRRNDEDPTDRKGLPKLTVSQVALLQGFPEKWTLCGGKTARYRQVGHAMPPPLARALGERLARALTP
ncbi:DNA cytosine methyltransferase [Actinomadura macrotermitis]|uniref:DNA (cytosine-5-)-methyltransferase n=1 Tax=Actinomadura macrotermitis TaxID=2585200 RepID=A0A7K0BTY6_9ACTN|nr:DNA cytosine methyltransferase [Actinomadura macrotermitis]MQY04597.1 putative BsuMI modification methylase subunit YdiP [Actinomadura macrotermitis]